MTGAIGKKRWRRTAAGARVSKGLLRWPARNYFAELEPSLREGHPVDDLMARDRTLTKIRQRAGRLLARVQVEASSDAVLDFEAARNHLDATRVEVAYNLGFEGGLIAGRAEGLRRSAGPVPDAAERALLAGLRLVLEINRPSPDRTRAVLQEMAWAFAVGAPTEDKRRALPLRSRRPSRTG